MFDVNREEERSIAHKTFNITDQTSIQHLQTFSIKRQLAMYRYRLNDVPKRYFACTEVVLQKTHVPELISYTEVVMYRNCPPLCTETVMYRKRRNPFDNRFDNRLDVRLHGTATVHRRGHPNNPGKDST